MRRTVRIIRIKRYRLMLTLLNCPVSSTSSAFPLSQTDVVWQWTPASLPRNATQVPGQSLDKSCCDAHRTNAHYMLLHTDGVLVPSKCSNHISKKKNFEIWRSKLICFISIFHHAGIFFSQTQFFRMPGAYWDCPEALKIPKRLGLKLASGDRNNSFSSKLGWKMGGEVF